MRQCDDSFGCSNNQKNNKEKAQKKNMLRENNNTVIIVKPQEMEQTTEATKQELRRQIDRATNNIRAMRNGNERAVMLSVKSLGNVENIFKEK